MSEQRHCFEFGSFRLDPFERLLLRGGSQISVTPKVFETLLVLVENSGHVLEKDELMRRVWPNAFVEEANLAVNISILRKTLGEDAGQKFIEAVPKRGYRFATGVRRLPYETATLVVEEHTRSRLIIEEEEESDTEGRADSTQNHEQARGLSATLWQKLPASSYWALPVVLLVAGALIVYYLWSGNNSSNRMAAVALPRSIAVLLFATLSAQGNDEYLGLAMADALITKLSNVRKIVVRPTSAVRQYSDAKRDVLAIGRRLGVDAVLDGNIQREGGRIRVTVQLINLRDGAPLWSEKFDGRADDVLTLQDSVSEKLATALALNLSAAEKTNLRKH